MKRFAIAFAVAGFSFLAASPACIHANPVLAATRKLPPSTQFNSPAWRYQSATPHSPGLSRHASVTAPAIYEESAAAPSAVAAIYVGRRRHQVMGANTNPLAGSWTKPVLFHGYTFNINGSRYTVPKADRAPHLLVLPLAQGIVWAPLPKNPTPLTGTTPLFYTPYCAQGGSLAAGAIVIGRVPHAWYGLDGPIGASAWTGWLSQSRVAPAHVATLVPHQLLLKNGSVKSDTTLRSSPPGWPTLLKRADTGSKNYQTPHYTAWPQSLIRTDGGMVLTLAFRRARDMGLNASVTSASYYWSEHTKQWTPINQNYTVQTLGAWTDAGSGAVYSMQPLPVKNGLDVLETYFNPATLTIRSIWLGNWVYGPSFVKGRSWIVAMPSQMPKSGGNQPLAWTVYTP